MDIEQLLVFKREISQLRYMVQSLCLFVLLVACLVNIPMAWYIPQYERFMVDLVGSRDKLPQLTLGTLDYVKSFNGFGMPLVVLMSTFAAFIAVIAKRFSSGSILFYFGVLLFLLLHWATLAFAVNSPMLQIMQMIATGK